MKSVSILVLFLCISYFNIDKAQAKWNPNLWTLYCSEGAGDIDYDIGFDEPHKNSQGKIVLDIRDSRFSEHFKAMGQISETSISAKIYEETYRGIGDMKGTLNAQKGQNGIWKVFFKPAFYNKPTKELNCKYY